MTHAADVGSVGPTTTSSQDSSSVSDKAKETAGTTVEQTRHVASAAQDEARNVASEAKAQARGLVDQATTQVEEQSREQARRLAGTVRNFGDDLQTMAESGNGGMAADLARQVADRARSLSSQLEDREPRELLGDVKDFARRRPGTFLLGALAAGVVAGRLARGAREAQSDGSATGSTASSTPSYGGSSLGGSDDRLRGTGLTDTEPRPSSGAAPTGLEDASGTATGDPLAGATRADVPTSERPVPTDPSAPGGRA